MSTNENFNFPGYEVYEQLGAGGGGSVFKAYHKNLRKAVVIKKIHEHIKDESIQRSEVDILKNLHHPNLPQVFDYFVVDGIGYTVMDYVEGDSLGNLLKKGQKFTEKQVIKYATQLCEAVAYLHNQAVPIIHGDIKPDNIMLKPDDNICLIDFNISGISENGTATTLGYTKGYSAPEQYIQFVKLKEMLSNQQGLTGAAIQSSTGDDRTEIAYSEATEVLVDDEKTEIAYTGDETEIAGVEYKVQATNAGNAGDKSPSSTTNIGIIIDKRSDIYSIAATIYHLYVGKLLDKNSTDYMKANASDGLIYVLNKALSDNPDKRYQSGGEMLKALQSIYKLDKRYKAMLLRQNIVRTCLILMACAGIFLIRMGIIRQGQEANIAYQQLIEQMIEAREAGADDIFEGKYNEAVLMRPDSLDAYYQKALMMYERRDYEGTLLYIEQSIVGNDDIIASERYSDIYYLVGDCYMELEDYKAAQEAFADSISYSDQNPNVFANYAISLARTNDISKAKEALGRAEALEVENPYLLIVSGEISLAENDYVGAMGLLEKCVKQADDSYMLQQAYLAWSRAYEMMPQEQGVIDEHIQMLQDAKNSMELKDRFVILERLAQVCINANTELDDESYALLAIEALNEIVDAKMQWDSLRTHLNLVNLYRHIEDYDSALKELDGMSVKYGNNYNVPKQYAFVEIALQEKKSESERDYHTFYDYYQQAKELYEGSKQNDMDMQLLDSAYQQLIDGNWL